MDVFLTAEAWIALLTLTFLEIVLGIDNIVFISIISNKLPEEKQERTRRLGLAIALLFRIGLLVGIKWIIGFTEPLFTIGSYALSGRDLILGAGGLFLLGKSTSEIHQKMEGHTHETDVKPNATVFSVIFQIIVLDIVFSFDSILTAIGLSEQLAVMIVAIIIAMVVMMLFAGRISKFIKKHPTLEVLALSFLILIGFMLIVEGVVVIDGEHLHVPKGYIYFAVFFSLMVELINMRLRKRQKPVKLHKKMEKKTNY